MKTIEQLKSLLIDAIAELDGYIKDEDNGYDDCERHDCQVTKEAYEYILKLINN